MKTDDSRWSLPDITAAIAWCSERNKEGIRCVLHVLGEHAAEAGQTSRAVEDCLDCIRMIDQHSLSASLSLKLSDLGATFDPDLCRRNAAFLIAEGAARGVPIEIDMEGRPLVERTVEVAVASAKRGTPPTLTLQAYLERTPHDLMTALDHAIPVRFVKGAYLGDITDFYEIQDRYKVLLRMIGERGVRCHVGTHDPDIVGWIMDRVRSEPERVEFGFLMGIADRTKTALARSGWKVSEYVPFGAHRRAYVMRRTRYLETLVRLGRTPLP